MTNDEAVAEYKGIYAKFYAGLLTTEQLESTYRQRLDILKGFFDDAGYEEVFKWHLDMATKIFDALLEASLGDTSGEVN